MQITALSSKILKYTHLSFQKTPTFKKHVDLFHKNSPVTKPSVFCIFQVSTYGADTGKCLMKMEED